MIKEFAVEPDVIGTWRYFQTFWDDFGFSRGRVISAFPAKWRKLVFEAADKLSMTMKAYTIKSRVSAEHLSKVVPSGRAYPNPPDSWLRNAEAADALQPFDGILAMANPRTHLRVLCADDVDKSVASYAVRSQIDVPRQASDIAATLSFALRRSRTLTLIDAYFRPGEQAFSVVAKALIAEASIDRPLAIFEIHCLIRDADIYDRSVQEGNIDAQLVPFLPANCKMTVSYWRIRAGGKRFHSRHILCDNCGIQLDPGLDQGRVGEFVQLILMEEPRLTELRADFGNPPAAYDLCPQGRIERIGI